MPHSGGRLPAHASDESTASDKPKRCIFVRSSFARAKAYTSAPRAGAVGTKSRRGLSRASQIDARRMQHTAIIHMAH
jgi:hypothetical protein